MRSMPHSNTANRPTGPAPMIATSVWWMGMAATMTIPTGAIKPKIGRAESSPRAATVATDTARGVSLWHDFARNRAARRGRHRGLGGAARPPGGARGRGGADRRPGRRQDELRARLHRGARRPSDRGAEPDLHAGADLRPAVGTDLAFRPLSPRTPRRRHRAGNRRGVRRRHQPDRMAR